MLKLDFVGFALLACMVVNIKIHEQTNATSLIKTQDYGPRPTEGVNFTLMISPPMEVRIVEVWYFEGSCQKWPYWTIKKVSNLNLAFGINPALRKQGRMIGQVDRWKNYAQRRWQVPEGEYIAEIQVDVSRDYIMSFSFVTDKGTKSERMGGANSCFRDETTKVIKVPEGKRLVGVYGKISGPIFTSIGFYFQ